MFQFSLAQGMFHYFYRLTKGMNLVLNINGHISSDFSSASKAQSFELGFVRCVYPPFPRLHPRKALALFGPRNNRPTGTLCVVFKTVAAAEAAVKEGMIPLPVDRSHL